MKISLKRLEEPYHFEAENESGNRVHIDASPAIGGLGKGARPMELLLMGLASCSAIDIISILKKQRQTVRDFTADVNGEREQGKEASVFTAIHIHFKAYGEIEKDRLETAIHLSLDKYCSAAKTLEKTAKITHSYEILP